jgi:outer membrane protein assembly factor BamA
VPAEGGLNEDVRRALEELLAAQGIKATVMATAAANTGLHKVMAISYAIVAPPVEVGEIHLDSASVAPDRGVMEILAKLTGSAYDTEGSPSQISTYLGNYYHDNGYLEADIHATAENAPSIAPEAIRIPFLISIAPGALYRLSGVQLADSLAVTQADFDRQSLIHPGEIAGGQRLVEEWEFVARQYHNKGYLKASIHPTPSYDRAHGTVAFAVTVEPGPVYTMGKLTLENVSDDLRAMILAAWKMPPGAVFNEGAIRGFFATVGVNPALERVFKTINIKYSMRLNDDTKTVDVALRLERKP